MPTRFRLGVAGVGHIGRNHARIYGELAASDPQLEFAAILDADTEVAQQIAEKTGARVVSTVEEFAASVDAASIATPTPSHFPLATQLLKAGKHLLVEKPITETPAEARELCDLARAQGCVLQIGHVERFNPVLTVLESAQDPPRFIEAHRLSPYPNRSTEIGVVLDLMIHDLEVILHLVRSPLESFDAVGIPVLSKGEDIANVRLRFANGCVANVTASRISAERLRKIRVFQASGYLSLDYQKQEGFLYRLTDDSAAESSLWKKLTSAASEAIVSEFAGRKIVREPVRIEKDEPLKRQLASFAESARLGATPRVTGDQGAAALALAVEITRRIAQSPSPTTPS